MREDSLYYLPSINVLQSAALFHGVDTQMMEIFFKSYIIKKRKFL